MHVCMYIYIYIYIHLSLSLYIYIYTAGSTRAEEDALAPINKQDNKQSQ